MSGGIPSDLIEALRLAPYDPSFWTTALEGAAACSGSSSAQLLSYSDTRLPMLLAPGFTSDDIAHYVELGGGDIRVNRGMAFMTSGRAIPLRPYADHEYMTDAERRRDTLYNEFFGLRDGTHIAVGVMIRKPSLMANLSLLRTSAMEREDQQTTARLMPLIARACDLQHALEGRSAAIMAQTLDALGDAILLCDMSGHLVSATSAGEALLRTGRLLKLRQGQISCADSRCDGILSRLLTECATVGAGGGLGGGFAVRGPGATAARIDVAPIPTERGMAALQPLALVRIRETTTGGKLDIACVMAAFGLTRAEAEVAEGVFAGLSSRVIAERRNVSGLTVDSQVQSIMAKVQCRRRAELPQRLTPFTRN